MKTKVKTKSQKTKIFALLLVLLLSVCCMLFAGCAIVDPDDWDENEGGSGGSGGSGNQSAQFVPNKFKLGYRGTGTDEEAKNNIADLSKELVEDFATTFGAGKGFGENQNVYYYDSIRYQAYQKEIDDGEGGNVVQIWAQKSFRWNWSFDNNKNGKPIFQGAANMREKSAYENEEYYTQNKIEEYQNFYSKLYSQSMEVVLYEILLGRTDYQNMIVIGGAFDSEGYPQISYRGKSVAITDGKPTFDAILSDLQAEYFDKTT